MKFQNLFVRTTPFTFLFWPICACQPAKRRPPLLPPATAPSLKAAAPSPATAQPKSPAAAPAQTNAPAPQTQVEKPSSAEALPPAPQPDPVVDLIARVEKDYQAGVANYQAGKPDAAKKDFDRAF